VRAAAALVLAGGGAVLLRHRVRRDKGGGGGRVCRVRRCEQAHRQPDQRLALDDALWPERHRRYGRRPHQALTEGTIWRGPFPRERETHLPMGLSHWGESLLPNRPSRGGWAPFPGRSDPRPVFDGRSAHETTPRSHTFQTLRALPAPRRRKKQTLSPSALSRQLRSRKRGRPHRSSQSQSLREQAVDAAARRLANARGRVTMGCVGGRPARTPPGIAGERAAWAAKGS
jgi:hypothetical protein